MTIPMILRLINPPIVLVSLMAAKTVVVAAIPAELIAPDATTKIRLDTPRAAILRRLSRARLIFGF